MNEIVEEEEEVLVVAHIPGLEEVLGSKTHNLVLTLDEKGQSVHASLNDNILLKGNFEVSLGTQLLFKETANAKSIVPENPISSGMQSVECIGLSITSLPLELESTMDIDKLNNAIENSSMGIAPPK